jgi:hypothetical protein
VRIDSDIDIDLGNRELILAKIKYIPAAMNNVTPVRKHATGIYITEIPYDPVNDMSSIDYVDAEDRGYFKLDLLNVHVYNKVRDENHLLSLMHDPNWNMLNDRKIVEQLIHLNNSYDLLRRMPEPIDSIPRLAMFLAVIRPSKRHLLGKTYKEIMKTVWEKDDTGYQFRKSHAIAYSQLVVVHMNLLTEQGTHTNE